MARVTGIRKINGHRSDSYIPALTKKSRLSALAKSRAWPAVQIEVYYGKTFICGNLNAAPSKGDRVQRNIAFLLDDVTRDAFNKQLFI
jgi:hypothetical protein